MDNKILLFVLCCFTCLNQSIGQKISFNTTLKSVVSFNENSSDVWGYEKEGIKYAIIGTATKTKVYSLEDVTNPVLRFEAPGVQSIWRDIKSYKNHLYVTTDQGADGLVIIDMTGAPETITFSNFKPMLAVGIDNKPLERCHNLYIDENGFAYLAGCNISQRGVLIFDLNQDPNNPVYMGAADLTYSHDAFTSGDTLYASEINIGKLGIYDVSDKSNPKLLANQTTSRSFTHNAWPSDDGKYVFTTDEKGGAYMDAYDISDFSNIKMVDKFRPLERENDNVIPHNAHYYNGYLIVSWYTDGVRIIDAHKPDNLIEVAYYDTWEDPSRCHNGFFGCWGAFPYTNSNLIYASDINNGLVVIEADYKRACYLEGKVSDQSGNSVNNAFIEILSNQINKEYSNPGGLYKTGQVLSGTFKVRITHPDYLTREEEVVLINGEVTNLDVVMSKKAIEPLTFDIRSSANDVISTKAFLKGQSGNYNFDLIDNLNVKDVLTSNYDVFVGSWGYLSKFLKGFEVAENTSNLLKVVLDQGYADNFEQNLGWTVNSTSNMSGAWVRGKPRMTEFGEGIIANPGSDSDDDGEIAYVTGNGLPGAGCDDVDNGVSTLLSPTMDLTLYSKPKLNYDVWYFNAGGSTPINDTLVVSISNGSDQAKVIVDKIYGITDGWLKVRDLDIKSFIDLTDNMILTVEVSDQSNNQGHIVEAGFDNFFISDAVSSLNNIHTLTDIQISPNPSMDFLYIRLDHKALNSQLPYSITNSVGKAVMTGNFNFFSSVIDIQTLDSGIYFIQIPGYITKKFIKI